MRPSAATSFPTLLAAACVAFAADPALAADRRVPQDFATIQDAVTAAQPGDRIVVTGGVHTESVVVTGKDGLTFLGRRGAVWDGTVGDEARDALDFTGDGLTVTGFRFRNGLHHVYVIGDRAKVTRCTSTGSDTAFVGAQSDDLTVERCTVRGAGREGVRAMGSRIRVTRSRLQQVASEAVSIEGPFAQVTRNTLVNCNSKASVTVMGDDALVQSNRLTATAGICVLGARAVVERNACVGGAVIVEGTDAEVLDNSMTYGWSGFSLAGQGLRAEGNRATDCSGDGIQFNGELGAGSLVGNTLVRTGGLSYRASHGNAPPGGEVSGNRLEDCQKGLDLGMNGGIVRRNVVVRCGRYPTAGILYAGNDGDIAENTVQECWAGVVLFGDGTTVARTRVSGSVTDGFVVALGSGNAIVSCQAEGCGGEGFENRGQGTDVRTSRFTGSRIDFANAAPSATLDDTTGTTYGTGSPTTQPEVGDWIP